VPPSAPSAMPDSRFPSLSFEFFPPKTEAGAKKLWDSVRQLARLQPQFVSVTCGATGSAIEGTSAVVHRIRERFGCEPAPHVAIGRQSRARIRDALRAYKDAGIRRIVAIRGDDPQTASGEPDGDLYPNTVDFVAELRRDFGIDPIVAAYPDVHPRAQSPQQDLDHLRRKAEAGAALAISQFFFLPETFLRFRDRVKAAGIVLPLVPGIMPINSLAQTVGFAEGCGTAVPAGFAARFERHGIEAKALFDEGVAHAAEVCECLRREGVAHFHFYTLNRWEMVGAVCEKLGFGGRGSGVEKISPKPEPRTLNPQKVT
jgi:methylenetetrahydrofolate reductase (NADPH)